MRIFRKIALLLILPLGLSLLALESWGSYLNTGNTAPNFLVESGDSRKLSLDMVRGRVIVLFYESRHVIRKNIALKDELTKLYRVQSESIKRDIFRLVVIDCSEAVWSTLPIWKRQLNAHSKKEGFTIYGDWNRTMLKEYGMKVMTATYSLSTNKELSGIRPPAKLTQSNSSESKSSYSPWFRKANFSRIPTAAPTAAPGPPGS